MSEWRAALDLEYRVSYLHSQQVLAGVGFDIEAAKDLLHSLSSEMNGIEKICLDGIPPKVIRGKLFDKIYKMNGERTVIAERRGAHGPYTEVEFRYLNLGSDKQVKEYLLENGWKPTEWNVSKTTGERTSPKLTEDSFDSVSGEIPKYITRYMMLKHRRGLVEGLIGRVRSDGRIAADAMTCGANSGRYTHIGVANLPRVTTPFGKEIRALFIAPEGRVLIGSDLSGIENRIAAHYTYPLDNGATARDLLLVEEKDGKKIDAHQRLADKLGISRDHAKTVRYASLYGVGPKKLSSMLRVRYGEAKRMLDGFWRENRALDNLRTMVEAAFNRNGYVRGLDGRKLYPRKAYSALNLVFQSAATIVFKRGMVIANERLKHLDTQQVIAYHDETQREAWPEDVDEIVRITEESWREAGEYYNLNVPIDSETKVGKSWADTH